MAPRTTRELTDAPRRAKDAGPAGTIAPSAGWTALAAGRWKTARRAFAATLKSREAPDTFEGLSWAAWWLDDGAAVLDARARAFRLYHRRGDLAGAARMAIWLAADHLDFNGASAVAAGWLQRARRLLDRLDRRPEHGWLAFHEGYIAFGQGDTSKSAGLGRRAAETGRRFDVPDLEMLGLALEGTALVASAKVEPGMRCLDEAAAIALEADATIPISRAWTCCFMVTACEMVRDYDRAFQWCDRIAEFADRHHCRYMLGFCCQHYGTVHMARGQWREAEARFLEAIEAYARSRPAFVDGVRAGLGELRRRQGRLDESEELLGTAAAPTRRARLAFDRGDAQRALELAERELARTPAHLVFQRAPALEMVIAAAADRGELREAAAALTELKTVAVTASTAPMRAAASLAGGLVAAASGDHARARRLLEDAADGFDRSETPFEAAHARLALANTLLTLGRRIDAMAEARASLACFDALGAAGEARRARDLVATSAAATRHVASPVPEVSRREREVLRCLAQGLTNRQIAVRLFVSEHTIHRHVTSILRKLDLPTRTAAAAHAVRAGLLESGAE